MRRKPSIDALEQRRAQLLSEIAALKRVREQLRRAALRMESRVTEARAAEFKTERR
jgi:hypothetical protein